MAVGVVEEKVYPAPLAMHEEVINDGGLFMDTLRRFHIVMGTRFMIPVIGGKELDLHLLYREVTRRGGFEKVTNSLDLRMHAMGICFVFKVVRERKWKEVISAFNFPPTTTSASFVLRKYYISLLHHYEQVHFFRVQGPLVPPAVTMAVRSPPCNAPHPGLTDSAPDSRQQAARKRCRGFSAVPIGVTGIIDGKFDNGYFVTVNLGFETLHGVLYHLPISEASSAMVATQDHHDHEVALAAAAAALPMPPHLRQRRKRGRRRWDPAHPKPNRSAYNFFFAEKHSKLKLLYPQREREFSKMIGESWGKLTQEERTDSGLKDKERYRREMQEYRERLKLMQPKEPARAGPSSHS
ncbi:hypothetical protein ACLOJK_002285 [Asimina triloba]